jgi:hypothetical protein
MTGGGALSTGALTGMSAASAEPAILSAMIAALPKASLFMTIPNISVQLSSRFNCNFLSPKAS